ncbi:MAG: hypothetical protein U0704_11040 [Candidatus Eisenbacteria bacterium]
MRFLRPAVVVLALACAVTAHAAKAPARAAKPSAPPAGELTIVYGDDHAFGVVAPAGWVVDDSSGLGSRIRVVLYPKGQKWDTAPTVIYANPLHQKAKDPKSLPQMIDRDVAAFRKANPRGKVNATPVIPTRVGKVAQVREFSPTGGDPVEAVAYVPEDDLVMLLVLTSREPAGYRAMLPAFREFVKNYQFVGGNLQTPTAR